MVFSGIFTPKLSAIIGCSVRTINRIVSSLQGGYHDIIRSPLLHGCPKDVKASPKYIHELLGRQNFTKMYK